MPKVRSAPASGKRSRERRQATAPTEEEMAAAANEARSLSKRFVAYARRLDDGTTPASTRALFTKVVFGHARASGLALWDDSLLATSKRRKLLALVGVHAAGVRAWSMKQTPHVAVSSAELAASDRAVSNQADQAVKNVIEDFARLYPSDAAKIERSALRRALLTWLDTDRGRRPNTAARAKKAFGGSDKFKHFECAIAGTDFATTKGTIETEWYELKRPAT